jgi:hypothetical protein
MAQNWNAVFDVTNLDTTCRWSLTALSSKISTYQPSEHESEAQSQNFWDHDLIPTEMHLALQFLDT